MKKLKEPKKKVNPSKPLNGATLQAAVTWAIGRKLFSGVKVHGNTVWQMVELVVLAMVRVFRSEDVHGCVWRGEAVDDRHARPLGARHLSGA